VLADKTLTARVTGGSSVLRDVRVRRARRILEAEQPEVLRKIQDEITELDELRTARAAELASLSAEDDALHHIEKLSLADLGEDAALRVDFGCEGVVWQNTGDDWNDVDVVLSTMRQSLGAEPPSLTSDILDVVPKSATIRVETRDQAVEENLGSTSGGGAKPP